MILQLYKTNCERLLLQRAQLAHFRHVHNWRTHAASYQHEPLCL